MIASRKALLGGVAVLAFLAAGAAAVLFMNPAPAVQSAQAIGGPFKLKTGRGDIVTDRDFRGKWLLVYFGYTHCPDICPTTLAEVVQTIDRLGAVGAEVQPLFITIDPERDTPEVMDAYVQALDARIIGLTGTPADIAAAAKGYKVHYAKVQSQDNKQDYAMEHSSFVYLIGPDGGYVTLFTPGAGQAPDNMAPKLRELIGQSRGEKSAR
jgi:protein SCO1/2